MKEQHIPERWIGSNVRLELIANEPYSIVARVEEMNDAGLVALTLIDVPVAEGRTSPMDNPIREKLVPKFFPWHSVHATRELEQEEEPLPGL